MFLAEFVRHTPREKISPKSNQQRDEHESTSGGIALREAI
jgi:hypothetical protein